MLIIGENEERNGSVSVRQHKKGDLGEMSIAQFAQLVQSQVDEMVPVFEN
jgi:threonyl-tRNA synthetase